MRLPSIPWFVDCLRETKAWSAEGARLSFGRRASATDRVVTPEVLIDYQRGEAVEAFARAAANANRPRAEDGLRRHYPYQRACAGEALILARATVKGATWADHVALAERMLNVLLTACDEAAVARAVQFTPTAGGFLLPPDVEDGVAEAVVETEARYLVRFFLACPVVSKPIGVGTIASASNTIVATT